MQTKRPYTIATFMTPAVTRFEKVYSEIASEAFLTEVISRIRIQSVSLTVELKKSIKIKL